jgi:hypothetical protein
MISKNEFEKEYYKLLNNSVYDKWMEDVSKYVHFQLFTSSNSSKYKRLHMKKPYMIKRTTVHHRCAIHGEDPTSDVYQDEEG